MNGGSGSQLTTAEAVGVYFQVAATTIRELARGGKLPPFSAGMHLRFRREAVDPWIRET